MYAFQWFKDIKVCCHPYDPLMCLTLEHSDDFLPVVSMGRFEVTYERCTQHEQHVVHHAHYEREHTYTAMKMQT